MGHIVTPPYRIEYRTNHLALGLESPDMISKVDGRAVKTMIWNVTSGPNRTGHGLTNAANLEAWRKTFNASFQKGGANFHISEAAGSIPHVTFARIVGQFTGKVLAEVTAPMFEVA